VRIPLTLISGIIVDAFDKGRMLVIGTVFSAIGILLLLSRILALIITGRVLVGVFGVFLTPTIWALISEESFKVAIHGRILSSANALTAVASILAPAVAGYVASTYGYDAVILASALLLFGVTPLVWIVSPKIRRYRTLLEVVHRIPNIIRDVYRYSVVLALEWYMLYSNMMLLPLYMDNLMYNAEVIGFAIALETLIYALSQLLVGYIIDKHRSKYTLMLSTALVYGFSLTYIPHCKDLLQIIFVLAVAALSSSPISSVVMTRATEVSSEPGTLTMGVLFSFGYMGMTLGTVISGYLAQSSYQLAYGHLIIPGVIITILALYEYLLKEVRTRHEVLPPSTTQSQPVHILHKIPKGIQLYRITLLNSDDTLQYTEYYTYQVGQHLTGTRESLISSSYKIVKEVR